METSNIIQETIVFVKKTLAQAEGGHDWFHIERVYRNALQIAEGEKVDKFVVALAALLHDIADAKFHNGNEDLAPKIARDFLQLQQVTDETIDHVVQIIRHISFKQSLDSNKPNFHSKELEVVRDADRLDALGAIGIARAFNYGGFKNRLLYHPEIKPQLTMTKEQYKNTTAPTLNHFYEKLLLLKDKIHTETAQKIAQERHDFMVKYLEQFHKETGIEPFQYV